MSLVLSLTDIWKSYNGKPVLKDCSYSFGAGIYVLMGPNGSGKSTFLRICTLLENPDEGKINYFSDTHLSLPLLRGELKWGVFSENNIFKKRDIELKRRITLLLPRVGVFNTTVFKNAAYGLKIRGMGHDEIEKKVNTVLEFVGLSHKKNHNAIMLSSGETQRLGIARAMVIEPEALFLDEPTASVDQENTEIIENIILNMKEENGSTVIIATHDTSQAERLVGRVLIMQNGKIIEKTF
ncbi:MAG: ATP-binding cassette domain-containing protein [Nitrospirae bacterium]|nr:ATP-binding cassette domain-containing protein [Nitrospirota bacterium]